MKEKELILIIEKEFEGKTLLEYLLTFRINKSYINNLISSKKVILNSVTIKNGNMLIKEGDKIIIMFPIEETTLYNFEIDVIYEDDWIIVVNKPANILVHTDGLTNNTLTNAVHYYLKKKEELIFAFPIHRLDFETTGIVVFAKNKLALAYLSVAIEQHELNKEYVCLCKDPFQKEKGIIDVPIGKDRHSQKQRVSKTGKEALSTYEVIKNGQISKVKVIIEHGRKHQIRVHMSHIKHPIIGDKLYGIEDNKGLKLHFKKVSFIHPYTRKPIELTCKEDF